MYRNLSLHMLPSQQQKKTSGLSFLSTQSLLQRTWKYLKNLNKKNKEHTLTNLSFLSAHCKGHGSGSVTECTHEQTHHLHVHTEKTCARSSVHTLQKTCSRNTGTHKHTPSPSSPFPSCCRTHERKTFIK